VSRARFIAAARLEFLAEVTFSFAEKDADDVDYEDYH